MVDGVHFGEHTCVVALGIDIDGIKHPLSLVEGSTENATLVTELIVGLRERGLDVTRPILAGARRVQGAAPRGARRVRPAGDRSLPTPQDPKRRRSPPGEAAHHGRPPGCDGPITPTPRWPPRPNCARWPPSSTAPTPARRRACAKAWPRPSPCCAWASRPRSPARCARPTPWRRMISICRDPRGQRQALARRADGAALVRRRDGRGRQAVPPRQRPHAPAIAARHAGARSPNLSVPPLIMTASQPPDDHRAATEVPRNSGHPPSTF